MHSSVIMMISNGAHLTENYDSHLSSIKLKKNRKKLNE